MFGPRNSAYAVNLTYGRHTNGRHNITRKMVPIKGRAKVKSSDVHALCSLTYVKRAFRNKLHSRTACKQASRRCTHVHSSASCKIVSMRIVVLTYMYDPNIFLDR